MMSDFFIVFILKMCWIRTTVLINDGYEGNT